MTSTLSLAKQNLRIAIRLKQGALLPEYASSGAAGADVRACIDQPIVLQPGEKALVPTGLSVDIPSGYEIQVRPRSGLALKHGVTVLNAPGTVDSDYRGEIGVILINHGREPFEIAPKMRIAQLVAAPVVQADWVEEAELTKTKRGAGGFGHTGTN